MDTNKIIFSGRFEFGSARSFEKVVKMYEHRMENYYKNDVLLKVEDIFFKDQSLLNVPRMIKQGLDKSWKNTINLLEDVAQYAITGDLSAWMVKDGAVLRHRQIEPRGDKAAIRAYLKGRELVAESGKEKEALSAFNEAIEKFSRHAKAYERRGFINCQLGNHDDALYDYSKSIDINPDAANPYYGRAIIKRLLNDNEGALEDLNSCTKRCIPHQPVFWQARRMMADCYASIGNFEEAIKQLTWFNKRKFTPENPNYKFRRRAWFDLGKLYLEVEDFKASGEAFDKALQTENLAIEPSDAELLLYRGIAAHEAGESGYKEDWAAAADKGSEKAAELLSTAS